MNGEEDVAGIYRHASIYSGHLELQKVVRRQTVLSQRTGNVRKQPFTGTMKAGKV
jgi:hypothetical protein